MRSSVFSQGKSRMRSTDLHIFSGIRHTLADLIIHSSRREISKSSGKRNMSANGKTRRHSDHIRFRNSGLNKSLRKIFLKSIHLQRAGKVGTESHHFGI